MTFLQRLLLLVVVIELSLTTIAAGRRLLQPPPPHADLSELDAKSQARLSMLQSQATSGSAASWSTLADAYLGNGFFAQAESCYRRVLDDEPQDITCIYGLALSLSRSGRTSEAIDQFHRFVDVAGLQHADAAWYQIGRCFLREENAAEAELAFRQVRHMPEGELQLAQLLLQTGREPDAGPLIEKLLEKYPQSVHVQKLAMRCARQQGEEQDAARHSAQLETASYQFVLGLDVSDVDNYRTRAGFAPSFEVRLSPHDSTAPLSAIDRLTQQINDNPYWLHRRLLLPAAREALTAGRPQEAVALLDDLFVHSQITPQSLIKYGDAKLALQQPGEALQAWQHSLRLLPTAEAHERLADLPEEIVDAVQRRRHEALAHYYSGLTAYRANQPAAASLELREAVALIPDHARSWLYLGKTCVQLGRTEEATQAFRQCLELDPLNSDAHAALFMSADDQW